MFTHRLFVGFVGYDPTLKTVIVSHQGTDTSKLYVALLCFCEPCGTNFRPLSMPILTDANIILRKFDSTLFPGISSDVKVHDGFADSQARFDI